jgi:predicted CoA-substrate-specific enzyme activase
MSTCWPALGIDVGSVEIKAVLLSPDGDALRRDQQRLSGRTIPALRAVVSRIVEGIEGEVHVALTGGGKATLAHAGVPAVNDLVSTVRAAARLHPGIGSVIEVGGHQSKAVWMDEKGQMQSFSLNDQCAAGSGAFLEQQASRLKMTIEQFSDLAGSAEKAASIAGRCSVFAKSDMIHQQQKGTPPADIAFGLCRALARNFRATLLRGGELALPALFAGGGALNPGLRRAFRETFSLAPQELIIPEFPQHLAAHGAALTAEELGFKITAAELLRRIGECESLAAQGTGLLPTLEARVLPFLPEPVAPEQGPLEAWLGVDVGSVSTDFCLLSPAGEVIDGIYLRTRGDPVGVLKEGLTRLKGRVGDRLRVLGLGTTGSGRHLAGRLLGADVVKNEITCQLLGARHVLPEVDTILEIGGQDSKYVLVRDGRIAEFVMNKICAAGTGSFLEEQAELLGISIEDEFARRALAAASPQDLGSRCTVFMDTEVVAALQRGCHVNDILAGLAYSVAKNYLERVVGGRPVGRQVVFQGGVASNQAVVAAFERLLDRPVAVHPYNRLSGAIGAALAAAEEQGNRASSFRGFEAVEEVKVRTFECRACSNLCQVSKLSAAGRTSFFGDVCEKYTAKEGATAGAAIPDLPAQAEEMLETYAGGTGWLGTVGIPRASMIYDQLPFWATFFKSLGFKVVVSSRSTARTLDEGLRRLTAETCLPIKLAFGHVAELIDRRDVDFVFLPSILDLMDGGDSRSHLCPFEETVGFMTAAFGGERLVVPGVFLASPRSRIIRVLLEKLAKYDLTEDELDEALDAAETAYHRFQKQLQQMGSEALARHDGPVLALLGKPYNVLDRYQNLNLAEHARRLGFLPLPVQMIPLENLDLERLGVTLPWTYNRRVLRAMAAIERDRRVFPVVVSNFGCGPDAFASHYLDDSLRTTPSLFLEFDEHRGEAGLVTRLEAFLDEVRVSLASQRPRQIPIAGTRAQRPSRFEGRRFVLPFFADHAWAYLGALKKNGFEAVLLPPPDHETLAFGEKLSSGKECHPFVLLAGDLLKHIEKGTIGGNDIYLFPGTTLPCLMHEYGTAMRLALARSQAPRVEVLTPSTAEHFDLLGMDGTVCLGRGLLACELLGKLRCQVRPYTADPARVNAAFDQALGDLSWALPDDAVGDVLRRLSAELDGIGRKRVGPLPVVGVAGDIYTRIHPFGNQGLFEKLEKHGLEASPAPFLTDLVEFGLRREMSGGLDDGRYKDAFAASLLFLRKEYEAWRLKTQLGRQVDRLEEPGFDDVLALASPYVDPAGSEILLLNIAKTVDFVRAGAAGVINAISFHCMLGIVSASLLERVRKDHGLVPMITLVYSGIESPDIDAKLEAFAHQVKAFAAFRAQARPAEEPSTLERLRQSLKSFR